MSRVYPARGSIRVFQMPIHVIGPNGPDYYRVMGLDGDVPVGTEWDVPRGMVTFSDAASDETSTSGAPK